LILAFACGCRHERVEHSTPKPIPASATTAPSDHAPRALKDVLFSTAEPAAEFFMGDHLSQNFTLTLVAGGGYSMTCRGCVGIYGAESGTWRLSGDRIELIPNDRQGSFARAPVGPLRVRVWDQTYTSFPSPLALVPEKTMAAFQRDGVQDHTCFRPSQIVISEFLDESPDTWPVSPRAYDWFGRYQQNVMRHLPDLATAPVNTLDEALASQRLREIQARTQHMFPSGGGGMIGIDAQRGSGDGGRSGHAVFRSSVLIAVFPLASRGTSSGPDLLRGLQSDRPSVRFAASEALQAVYHIDLPHDDSQPPDSPAGLRHYRIWETLISPSPRPEPPK
jgi:hypothetical protein